MKVVFLASGAAGMYCGSCLRDNRLAATLIEQGRDVTLIPLYTPLRTDENDVSLPRVYYGGINVYLQQKSALFRRTPWALDRLLDGQALLRGVGRFAARTRAEELGALTVSVLQGEHGSQAKELEKLIVGLRDLRPDIINLPNLMFLGVTSRLQEALGCRVVCTLSGEDIFLDQLPEPYRTQAFDLIESHARGVDALVAVTEYYAVHAAKHFRLDPEKVHYVPMGVRTEDAGTIDPPPEPLTLGYFARVCPEKGFDVLCRAFVDLRRRGHRCRLRVAGYRGTSDEAYLADCVAYLKKEGAAQDFDDAGEVDRPGKLEFMRSLHLLSVPSIYAEAKGLYVLESLASGVPVVLPRRGSFPELVEATGGGVLYNAEDPNGLVTALEKLMIDPEQRRALACTGRTAVRARFSNRVMADETWSLFQRLQGSGRPRIEALRPPEPLSPTV